MANTILSEFKLFYYNSVSSTMDKAKELIENQKAGDRSIIISDDQTHGRGRHGNTWVSHHGNIFTSLIYNSDMPVHIMSYITGIAIAETLKQFDINAEIKWPNDVLINGQKTAGILIESFDNYYIVGIGINLIYSPKKNIKYKTTYLKKYSKKVVREKILTDLIAKLDLWRLLYQKKGFEPIKKKWEILAHNFIDSLITYNNEQLKVLGLNSDGALVAKNKYGDNVLIYAGI